MHRTRPLKEILRINSHMPPHYSESPMLLPQREGVKCLEQQASVMAAPTIQGVVTHRAVIHVVATGEASKH